MDLIKDYNISILYHPSNANMMVDALSKKLMSIKSLEWLDVSRKPLARELKSFAYNFM